LIIETNNHMNYNCNFEIPQINDVSISKLPQSIIFLKYNIPLRIF